MIVRDPPNGTLQDRKVATPGILGMNVLSEFYRVLVEQHGSQLFHSPLIKSAAPAALRALRHCEMVQTLFNAPKPFKIKVQGKSPICLGAGALTMVPVTCPQLETAEFLLEPLGFKDGQLPEGLLVSPTLVSAKKGLLYAPVVNVGCTEVWLSPRRVVGTVQAVVATSVGNKSVAVEPSWEECCAYVSTQEAISCSSVPESVLPDLEGLTPQQVVQVHP